MYHHPSKKAHLTFDEEHLIHSLPLNLTSQPVQLPNSGVQLSTDISSETGLSYQVHSSQNGTTYCTLEQVSFEQFQQK